MPLTQGVLKVAPTAGETVWSLLGRTAARYGMTSTDLRAAWEWRNNPSRSPATSGVRADAEILLDPAGQALLAALCRTDPQTLQRALPAWAKGPAAFTSTSSLGRPQARWQSGAAAHGPVAYACRPCTARRTGQVVTAMRYREGWQRVCRRHQRWTLGAGDGHDLEYLDLRACPEIAAAQQQWPTVARRAAAAGVAPGAVFAVARAVVCQWWDLALEWSDERIWPARLHALAGGDAGEKFWWWRAVAREAALFPETLALAGALIDPAVTDMVWHDTGGPGTYRISPSNGQFDQELGRRLGRPWLAQAGATTDSTALNGWHGAVVRQRHGIGQPGDWGQDTWWIPRDHQPTSVTALLRTLTQRTDGTITWRATIPRPERSWINEKVREATDLLAGLDPHDTAPLSTATHQLIDTLNQAIATLDHAITGIASSAHTAGIPLHHLAQWTHLPTDELQQDIDDHQAHIEDQYGYRHRPPQA
ncbi:DNA-binding protein [Streptacidiphilus sp. N1-12]|uniref:DNA-binding protein n=2 Tax=Streptacidiphilus alkalitolerans TaxID=3342712 RepID=A0ABV6WRG0_9ACTN